LKNKLNLGSGKTPLIGYINVDIRSDTPAVDIVDDVRNLVFDDETFIEILASDVIDHIYPPETRKLLRNCYRWLKPDGILRIHTPNLRFLAQKLAQQDNHEALKWLYGSDGEGSTFYPENTIRWCYSRESLRLILTSIGFTILESYVDCGGFGLSVIAKK